jgi:pyruvate dehydrogenase E2 component (dihydrolipoamide acetyltransferase)
MEFEAVDEGVLGRILVAEGTEGVKVNTPIAVLLAEGETAEDTGSAAAAAAKPSGAAKPAVAADAVPAASVPAAPVAVKAVLRSTCRQGPRCAPRPCARRSATQWPKRCAATSTSS